MPPMADVDNRFHVVKTWRFWLGWVTVRVTFIAVCVLAAAHAYFPGDLAVARRIQDLENLGFGPLAAFANTAGDTLWAIVITFAFAAVFLLRRQRAEAEVVILTFIPRGLRQLTAAWIGRPRPSSKLLDVRDQASGFSFPSGHATTAMVLYGTLFLLAGVLVPWPRARVVFRAACVLMIAATGLSRVYVGVHWPSDVLAGFAFGLIALGPLFLFYRIASDVIQRRRLKRLQTAEN
jgi:membrane-associated phospholipid phosphatase